MRLRTWCGSVVETTEYDWTIWPRVASGWISSRLWLQVVLAGLLALILCWAGTAHAQASQGGHSANSGPTKRGHFLKPEQYATQGALALFVDPTGSDSNACTASGTSACLTIQGAMGKIPFFVNYPVTVDIAAGNYDGFWIIDHSFYPASAATGAYINVRGAAQANTTPATGTATGTVTSVSTDSVGFHVVTDSGQTWTASDTNISTRFLSLTGGTGSGQVCPIISNTATAVTVSCVFSPAPVAGTTYAITSPSVVINNAINGPASSQTATGGAASMLINNIDIPRVLDGFVNIQDIAVTATNGRGANVFDVGNVEFQRVRFATTSNIGIAVTGKAYVSWRNGVIVNTTNACAATLNGGLTAVRAYFTATNSYLTNDGTANSTAAIAMNGNGGEFRAVVSEVRNTTTTGSAIGVVGGGNTFHLSTGRLRCSSASSNFGIDMAYDSSIATSVQPSATLISGTAEITACGTGLLVTGTNVATVRSTTTFLSNTLAVSATGGAKVLFNSAVPTFTTNTTDISVDGTTSTRAAFVALTPNSIVDLNYLSAVYLQP